MGAWESGPDEGKVKKGWRQIVKDLVDGHERDLPPGPRPPKSPGKQHDPSGRFVFEHDEIHHLSITANKHIVVGVEPCDVQERDIIELHSFGGHIVMLVNYIDGPKEAADGKVLLFIQGWPVGRGA